MTIGTLSVCEILRFRRAARVRRRRAGARLSCVAGLAALALCGRAHAAGRLRLDRSTYYVPVGQSLRVQVFLDMDDALPGDQVPAAGLFSAGVEVSFDPAMASVSNAAALGLPAQLDSDGMGGAALKFVGADSAGALGVLRPGETSGYASALVFTAEIGHHRAGVYTLTPHLYFTPPMASFVDFTGSSLDEAITGFVTAKVVVVGDGPAWWFEYGVVNPLLHANDYAAVNQGQLKWVANRALAALVAAHGSVSPQLTSHVTGLSTKNNYRAANLGQVKAVAKPFYDWLIGRGLATGYPWTGGAAANDYAVANIGQVKRAFSFEVP